MLNRNRLQICLQKSGLGGARAQVDPAHLKLQFRAPKFVRHYLFNVNVEQLWCLFGGSSKQREVAGGSKYGSRHGLRTPREEIAFTARPKIHSHSQIFRYGRSIFFLPHRPKFSDVYDLCLHWVSVVRGWHQFKRGGGSFRHNNALLTKPQRYQLSPRHP